MFVCFLVFAILPLAFTQRFEVNDNSINLHSNFKKDSSTCNLYDESTYCQQVTIDQRMSIVAVSHRCTCPDGYRCPNDIIDTFYVTQCSRDEERLYYKCRMRCAPIN